MALENLADRQKYLAFLIVFSVLSPKISAQVDPKQLEEITKNPELFFERTRSHKDYKPSLQAKLDAYQQCVRAERKSFSERNERQANQEFDVDTVCKSEESELLANIDDNARQRIERQKQFYVQEKQRLEGERKERDRVRTEIEKQKRLELAELTAKRKDQEDAVNQVRELLTEEDFERIRQGLPLITEIPQSIVDRLPKASDNDILWKKRPSVSKREANTKEQPNNLGIDSKS